MIDPQSEQVILKFWSGGHNGGCLDFGNDGYLYISTGDAAAPSPPDVMMTGQDCSDLLSSVLRIDVDHAEPGKPYRIPADNPFVNMPGVRPEIWAFGFRNPWKMSFDRATGDLWVGDVGWELWELIFKVKRGGNYGWSVMEGPQPVHVEARARADADLAADQGPPSLRGRLDHRRLRLSRHASARAGGCLHLRRLSIRHHLGASSSGRDGHLAAASWPGRRSISSAFGETHDGELYLLDHDRTHQIYRLVPNPAVEEYATTFRAG